MRIFFSLTVLISLFLSITSCHYDKHEDVGIVITAKYHTTDSKIYLNKVHASSVVTLDSTDLSREAEFTFRVNSPDYALFRLEHKYLYPLIVVAKNGDSIRVEQTDDPAWPYYVEGNDECMLVASYLEKLRRDETKVDSLSEIFLSSQSRPDFIEIREQLNKEFVKIHEDHKEYARTFVSQHPSSFASLIMINSFFREFLLFDQKDDFNYYEMVAEAVMEKMPDNQYAQDLYQHVKKIRKANRDDEKAQIRLSPGRLVPEFRLANINGDSLGPHDFKGRYLLIYFWAAYDASSRRLNPTVKIAYKTFHRQGLELMAISFDNDPKAWEAAIKLDSLPGIHFRAEDGAGSPLHTLFNLKRQLPAYFLIDRNGHIFAHNKDFRNFQQNLTDLIIHKMTY